ncbi:MAG: hypothetical protein ABJN34_04880 [Litoreibacter sp.]|uniref:hypothetical protein n=1 Tax=Litoreibacter sp. TaxID=1969459 RepID=UPI003298528A
MKLIFGLIIWTFQLIYLLAAAIFKIISQLFSNVSSATLGHLNENAERGRTYVRAYYYLESLESGGADSPETANRISSSLFEPWSDPDVDNRVIRRAMAYAKQQHGGNQLPIIAQAREQGFKG